LPCFGLAHLQEGEMTAKGWNPPAFPLPPILGNPLVIQQQAEPLGDYIRLSEKITPYQDNRVPLRERG